MNTHDALASTASYLYWTAPSKIVSDVYGDDLHSSYRREKEDLVRAGISRLWGALDGEHRQRLCDAVERYGRSRGLVSNEVSL